MAIWLLDLCSLALAPADCCVARSRDPIWGTICPHTQNSVVDRRVVDLLNVGNTLPYRVNPVKPNLIRILESVVVNIELPYCGGNLPRGKRKTLSGCSEVPDCVCRRAT